MRNKTIVWALVPVAVLAMGAAGCSAAVPESEPKLPVEAMASEPLPVSGAPVTIDAMEFYPSSTLDDWQAYTDVLVLAKVADEARVAPPKNGSAAEGADVVGRTITVDVVKTIWVDPKVPAKLGDSFTTSVSGWIEEGGKATEAAIGGGSRLEIGHEYVMALRWYPEVDDGDDTDPPDPASWGVVGSSAVLPADGGVIGQGEFLGVDEARIDGSTLPNDSMLALHLGQSVDEFISAMSDFHRVEREPVIEEPGGGAAE